jgi:hypothetical protein
MISRALLIAIAMVFSNAAASFGQGTADQAKDMLTKAVAAVKADKVKALDMFNKGEGGFREGDLYVFCINVSDGKFVASGNPNGAQLVGVDAKTFKDKDGNPFGFEAAARKPDGEITIVDYEFPKPGANNTQVPKQSYITKIGDLICGVGYYYFLNEKDR